MTAEPSPLSPLSPPGTAAAGHVGDHCSSTVRRPLFTLPAFTVRRWSPWPYPAVPLGHAVRHVA